MGKKHQELVNNILINQPENIRLFQSRAGFAWSGKATRKGKFTIIQNAVPFHGMPDGFPDICGWTETEITQDMVGQKIAVFTAIEVKTGKQDLKPEQEKFKDIILRMGGIFRTLRP